MPVTGKLTKDAWGADNVLPRDPDNGLEDPAMKQWCYWDGSPTSMTTAFLRELRLLSISQSG